MENINWTTLIIGGFIGALIAIPFAYFINLTTPNLQSWLRRKALSNKGKSVQKIIKEFETVQKYRANPIELTQSMIVTAGILIPLFFAGLSALILSAFMGLTALVLFTQEKVDVMPSKIDFTIFIIGPFVFGVFVVAIGFIFFSVFNNYSKILNRIDSFNEYEKDVQERVKKHKT